MAFKVLGVAALILGVTLAQSSVAFASHKKCEDWILKVSEKLDLNTEQKVKVKLFSHKAKIELTVKHHELREIQKHVNEAFSSGNINEAKVDDFAHQEEVIRGDIIKIRLHERFNVYSILDTKQKEKMATIVKAWEKEHFDKKKH